MVTAAAQVLQTDVVAWDVIPTALSEILIEGWWIWILIGAGWYLRTYLEIEAKQEASGSRILQVIGMTASRFSRRIWAVAAGVFGFLFYVAGGAVGAPAALLQADPIGTGLTFASSVALFDGLRGALGIQSSLATPMNALYFGAFGLIMAAGFRVYFGKPFSGD